MIFCSFSELSFILENAISLLKHIPIVIDLGMPYFLSIKKTKTKGTKSIKLFSSEPINLHV